VTDDKDLRSELERLASSVGDPPEHGLERVAARRHRRLRRRRGAVATAAVLAVLTAGVVAVAERRDPTDTVTSSGDAEDEAAPAALPSQVQVLCEPAGIVVPVASVRPERDGLHIQVSNSLGTPTVLEVDGDGWRSGEIPIPPGVVEVRQPVPPGELTIGCAIAGEVQRRRVDLVDQGGYYRVPELECERAEQVTLRDLPVEPAGVTNIIVAARAALDPYLVGGTGGDGIGPLRGYQSQRLGDATDDPVVQVTREGSVVAFAHVRGADDDVTPPWTTVSEAEVCGAVVGDSPQAEGTTSSTSAPAAGGSPAP
jgi:hypothetical protein